MCGQIVERLQKNRFDFYYEHADYDETHSEWSIEPCRKNMLKFLTERFLSQDSRSDQNQLPIEGSQQGKCLEWRP